MSYRSDGAPPIEELTAMLRKLKSRVRVIELHPHQYALSTKRDTREMLLVAT